MRTAQRSLRLLTTLMTTSLIACEYPLEPSDTVDTARASIGPADPALGISTTPRRPPPPIPIPTD